MKKYLIVIVGAITVVFACCVKDLEKYGFAEKTTLKGTVIDEKNGYVPVSGVNVSITNGSRTYESYITETDGFFAMNVNFTEIDSTFYLLLSKQGKTMKYALKGFGQSQYDYRNLALYFYLPTFEYRGITYEVYPSDFKNKQLYEAMQICEDLTYAGYDNWSLPSISELNIMYQNRSRIGGFSLNKYWSCSPAGSASFFYFDFAAGESHDGGEYNRLSFRPIRISTDRDTAKP